MLFNRSASVPPPGGRGCQLGDEAEGRKDKEAHRLLASAAMGVTDSSTNLIFSVSAGPEADAAGAGGAVLVKIPKGSTSPRPLGPSCPLGEAV